WRLWSAVSLVWPVVCGVRTVRCGLCGADGGVGRTCRLRRRAAKPATEAEAKARRRANRPTANADSWWTVDSGLTSRHSPSHRTVSLLTVTVEREVTNRRWRA
ncbi:Hypothetical predicted protein, partial [Olea europaea subsp. europaea]